MSPQYRLIKDVLKRCTGMDVGAFAQAKLNSSYPAFAYRINHGALKVEEYHVLNLYTGLTFEMIWPNPYTKIPDKIKLNLKPMAHPLDIQRPAPNKPMPILSRVDWGDEIGQKVAIDSPEYEMLHRQPIARQLPTGPKVDDITRVNFNPPDESKKSTRVIPGADSDDPYGGKIPVDD